MSPGNPARLLKLAEREFRQLAEAPPATTRRFKPIRLNAARFEKGWERKRLAAVQLTAVLLREDDATLERRVCEATKTYASAADWLERESAYLRKMARLLAQAGERVSIVLTRCREGQHSAP